MTEIFIGVKDIVACLPKGRIVETAKTAVTRERLCKCHVSVATVVHATMEVPIGTVFSMRSAPTATSPPNYKVTARRGVFCEVRPEDIQGEPIGALS
jgi:hypothetical protein